MRLTRLYQAVHVLQITDSLLHTSYLTNGTKTDVNGVVMNVFPKTYYLRNIHKCNGF